MKLYNTMTRREESVEPVEAGRIGMYTCGPTVYNFAHIGNFRAYMFEDILRRALKFAGYEVTQVMNLTDVDDKTIRGALETGQTLNAYTQPYKDAFFADLKALNIEAAEVYPAATDHIVEMIALVEALIEKGFAYVSEDNSVYFSVAKFPDYGKLAHLDLAGLQAGARVAQDEYEKESYGDFALWKAWDEKDGDVAWDSPWGRGRPGWHIECSAMGMKYLGQTFDIHTGGIDNLFPHHENEIAQSEAATGVEFVKLWLHCAHLRVNGEKMSKSAGNFFTLRDLLEKGYAAREIRYVLLSGHYRQGMNFTFDALGAARASLARLDEFARRVAEFNDGSTPGDAPEWLDASMQRFREAVLSDLAMPEALSAVFKLVLEGNRAMDDRGLTGSEAASVAAALSSMDQVLGVLSMAVEEGVPAEVEAMLEQRAVARTERNWAESDRLRDAMAELGWEVRDSGGGQKVVKRS